LFDSCNTIITFKLGNLLGALIMPSDKLAEEASKSSSFTMYLAGSRLDLEGFAKLPNLQGQRAQRSYRDET